MNTFFAEYIDLTVLIACFVFTIINTVRMVRRATVPLRVLPAFFVVFGATANATFMGVGHLLEISYHALERAYVGTFVYDFRFYCLLLMGMVLLALSLRQLRAIQSLFRGDNGSQRLLIQAMLLTVAVSAPTGVFTPVGYAPAVACGITALALPFVRKRNPAAPAVVVLKQVLARLTSEPAIRAVTDGNRSDQLHAGSGSKIGS